MNSLTKILITKAFTGFEKNLRTLENEGKECVLISLIKDVKTNDLNLNICFNDGSNDLHDLTKEPQVKTLEMLLIPEFDTKVKEVNETALLYIVEINPTTKEVIYKYINSEHQQKIIFN